ncbi:MAG TPA: CsgG/HfaB family protein [Nitrospinota bacterium]|jgi:hypothetical protein|nr:CsgG/HfaB family protein [Nitrospinota bacterium]|tara:strand:- start:4418 stop:5020 length:603 start_codon:yes stop_codon:yes gene_type:complete
MHTWKILLIGALLFIFSPSEIQAQEKLNKPVVMIMINEQIWVDNRIIYDYYGSLTNILNIWTSVSQTDTTFMGTFLEKGFRIVGSGFHNTTEGNVSKEDILKAIEGDDLTSTHLGNYLNADVIIVGKAIARGVSVLPGSRQKSARANINVRAIKVDTAEIIAVESGNATAAAIDEISAGVEAIKRAAEPIAKNLAKKIAQ